jgi:hypothetical protein
MAKPSEVIILAEDERQQRFARKFLQRAGLENHQMRFTPVPAGHGSGEQWVRKNYVKEVAAYRSRATRARSALLVFIDADQMSVANRAQQLSQELANAGLGPRTNAEAIGKLIPKRNIETWVLCLAGEIVDEATDYRNNCNFDGLVRNAADAFYLATRMNAPIPNACVQSLRVGVDECKRLAI